MGCRIEISQINDGVLPRLLRVPGWKGVKTNSSIGMGPVTADEDGRPSCGPQGLLARRSLHHAPLHVGVRSSQSDSSKVAHVKSGPESRNLSPLSIVPSPFPCYPWKCLLGLGCTALLWTPPSGILQASPAFWFMPLVSIFTPSLLPVTV